MKCSICDGTGRVTITVYYTITLNKENLTDKQVDAIGHAMEKAGNKKAKSINQDICVSFEEYNEE